MVRAATKPSAVEAIRNRLEVIEGGLRPQRRTLIPVAILLIAGIFAVAALQAYLAQEGFRAAKLERDVRTAQEQYVTLRAQVAQFSSPGRVAESAHKLGLTEPSNPIFLPEPADAAFSTDDARSRAPYETKSLLIDAP